MAPKGPKAAPKATAKAAAPQVCKGEGKGVVKTPFGSSCGFLTDNMLKSRATKVSNAADSIAEAMQARKERCYFTAELRVQMDETLPCAASVSQRLMCRVSLSKWEAPDLKLGNIKENVARYHHQGNTQMSFIRFDCLATSDISAATARIVDWVKSTAKADLEGMARYFGNPEWWRYDEPHNLRRGASAPPQIVLDEDCFRLDIVEGPHCCVQSSFLVNVDINWLAVLRGSGVGKLTSLISACFGDMRVCGSGGLTPLHLAALSGDASILRACVNTALEDDSGFKAAVDAKARSPLHLAALFDDADLIAEALRVCEADAADCYGLTAKDVASDLAHHASLRTLNGTAPMLEEMCSQRIRKALSQGDGMCAELGTMDAVHMAEQIPLHDYRALARLADQKPGAVDPRRLQRSMSCLECWYAELMNKGYGAAMPGCMELISAWDHLSTFQSRPEMLEDRDGEVLATVPGDRKPPTVADQATFLGRLRDRTGGILKNIDWSNVMMIGGMVLSCLIADDDEYARNFRETDVDLYIVGLSGEAFKQKVAEVVSSFPAPFVELNQAEYDAEGRKKPAPRVQLADDAVGSTVLRTPQTITICLRKKNGQALPNVQVVLAPYISPAHLLFTTDIDCTAMGFDGKRLVVTPRAREAIRRRRNLARPEKYMVRGEWRTEARLLKYARRGFRVVDIGLQPGTGVKRNHEVSAVASQAASVLEEEARLLSEARFRGAQNIQEELKSIRGRLEDCIDKVRALGIHGAHLLLLSKREQGLRRLLTHEAPLIRAGMSREALLQLIRDNVTRGRDLPYTGDSDEDEAPALQPGVITFNDGYGKSEAKLLLVNPSRIGGRRISDGRLRGREMGLTSAIEELDLESDRFEVRSWYEGCPERQLTPHATLEPSEWKGVGDFRAAP